MTRLARAGKWGGAARSAEVAGGCVEGEEARVAARAFGVGVEGAAVAVLAFGGFPACAAVDTAPDALGLGWEDGRAAGFLREEAGDGEGVVADHFCGEALAGSAGEEGIGRVAGDEGGRGGAGLGVGGAEGEFAEERFERPAVVAGEAEGEVVEEWLAGGQGPAGAEVLEGFHDAAAEEGGPEAVGSDACGQGVAVAHEPLGHGEAGRIFRGRSEGGGPCGGLGGLAGESVAAGVESGFAGGRAFREDRDGGALDFSVGLAGFAPCGDELMAFRAGERG